MNCLGCKNRNNGVICGDCIGCDLYVSNGLTAEKPTDNSKEIEMLAKLALNNVFGVQNMERKTDMRIEKVIFNDPATVVLWKDGTKTIVKCGDEDAYDPEKGLAMAIAKRALGDNGNYYKVFKKWLPEENTYCTRVQASAIKYTSDGMFGATVDFQDTDGLCDECIEAIAGDIVDRLSNVNPSLKPATTTTEKEVIEFDPPCPVDTPLAGDFDGYRVTLLSPDELAEKLGVTKATIKKQCREGLHPGALKVGGKWRIPYTEK